MANTTAPKGNQTRNQNANLKSGQAEEQDLIDAPDEANRQKKMILPKGTVIHIKNLPVELGEEVEISTKAENYNHIRDVLPDFAEANNKEDAKSSKADK